MAHRLAAIGGGYVWPNITFSSDSAFVDVVAVPTQPRPAEPLRYLAEANFQVAFADFETIIDAFNGMVCGRLAVSGIEGTDLQLLWSEFHAERAEPAVARRRKLEALVGCDPDEAADDLLDRMTADAERLGESAVDELDDADRRPFERSTLPWQRGSAAAAVARQRAGVEMATINDLTLARLTGVDTSLLDWAEKGPLAFAMRNDAEMARIVLRSPNRENRRFDLARLLGDRLINGTAEAPSPTTRS